MLVKHMKLLTPFLFLFLSITMLAAATSSRAERITVTSLADDGGAGELRAAISAANASPGATITFQDGLSGTITLTSGLPDITTSLWILGPGASTIKIDGAHTCRPFFESAAGNDTLTISGLTIQNGSDQSDSAITGGGAIFVETGSLAVNGCVLIGNIASTYGGAIYGSPSGETLIDCTVSSNSSRDSGGAIYGYTGPLTLTNCTVSQNQAGASGGAIEGSSAALTLTDCTLSGNSASDAGAIDNNSPSAILTGCTLSNNTAVDSGGAIYSATGPINLTDCLLSANSAALAGAFVNVGSGTFTNCTFSNNSSNGDSGYGGGAVFNSLTTSSVSFKDCTGYSNSTSTEAG